MPAGYRKITAHPAKPFRTIADAARDGQLIKLRCNLCRRTLYFLASDLVKVFDPKHPVHIPFCSCSRCKTSDCLDVTVHSPRPGDVGRLPVRRLAEIRQVQVWRNGVLGDE